MFWNRIILGYIFFKFSKFLPFLPRSEMIWPKNRLRTRLMHMTSHRRFLLLHICTVVIVTYLFWNHTGPYVFQVYYTELHYCWVHFPTTIISLVRFPFITVNTIIRDYYRKIYHIYCIHSNRACKGNYVVYWYEQVILNITTLRWASKLILLGIKLVIRRGWMVKAHTCRTDGYRLVTCTMEVWMTRVLRIL